MALNLPWIKSLANTFRVVLASGSPRRKELLDRLNIEYDVVPSGFAEDLEKSLFPSANEYVLENASRKAEEVYKSLKNEHSQAPLLVIGADTVVVSANGVILEKPASAQDAFVVLKEKLSGKTNTVLTGICLYIDYAQQHGTQPVIKSAVESTSVTFNTLDDSLIEAYVATGEPMDKAGSYAYQSLACFFVKEINGDYYNVVGFPCARFYQMLTDLHNKGMF
ncbi:hypothetical protein GGI25_001754 [Coemansia spiralis]|uniref:Uncharacterized protein n=2 Tax=Coemansia TaxID=4863 RepID=A0A9W8GC25_9FUNG|nr:Maf domain of N-Acetylserotonin O-methyltransferase-like protein [Coemansia spiralis]KAJ1990573.1 hypothetical protein EDC05_003993 [Coemansia umbellata]KAJ2624906.1 hypothetical protein GGI26_001018 [Coemansia sp. RSA 1358]KAJ2679186.1 hypothetical protein GGI25_001754 [Coemansia spiralis]